MCLASTSRVFGLFRGARNSREVFNAFWMLLCAIWGLFPEELHEDVVNAIIVDIPQLQQITLDSAQMQVGDFHFDGGFFSSPDGGLSFMLTIEATGD